MYEIMHQDGTTETAETLNSAIVRIATKHDRHPGEVGLDDRSSSAGTDESWHAWLAGSGEHGDPVAAIHSTEEGDDDEGTEPAPGWEDRAVARARREGILH